MCVRHGINKMILCRLSLTMASSKNIIANLIRGKKLNRNNYEIWSMKIQYVLEEQESIEVISQVMVESAEGTTI